MDQTPQKQRTIENDTPERFESDAHKIVRRHLQDKNHVITEEELRNVRVGMTPPPEEIDNVGYQGEEERPRENTDPAGTPLTPWDAVEP